MLLGLVGAQPGDQPDARAGPRRVDQGEQPPKVGRVGCRAELHAYGVAQPAHVLDVGAVQVPCALAHPHKGGRGVVAAVSQRQLERQVQGLVRGEDQSRVQDAQEGEGGGGEVVAVAMVDAVVPKVRAIWALNTIVREEDGRFARRNTDWAGMVLALRKFGGGGGTARAAVYALKQMGCAPIYLLGRSAAKVLAEAFPADYGLVVLDGEEAEVRRWRLDTSADRPADANVRDGLRAVLERSGEAKGTLLEMAYKPAVTEMMRLAESVGWKTIPGLELLVAQGVYQVSWHSAPGVEDPHLAVFLVRALDWH